MNGNPAPIEDRLDPARTAQLWTLLGCEGPPPGAGDALPALFHQIYFWPVPGVLAEDGLTEWGGLFPDIGLPRRMLAGGRVAFHGALKIGIAAEKLTHVRALTRKDGRTGKLAFVTLRHEIRQRGGLVLTEDQDIVLRDAFVPGEHVADGAPSDSEPKQALDLSFNAVSLFQFSALMMNAHRIHYDIEYARTEGYRGLVVPGLLLAQQLATQAQARLGTLAGFEYRATAPLFAGESARLCTNGDTSWIERLDGTVAMQARAR